MLRQVRSTGPATRPASRSPPARKPSPSRPAESASSATAASASASAASSTSFVKSRTTSKKAPTHPKPKSGGASSPPPPAHGPARLSSDATALREAFRSDLAASYSRVLDVFRRMDADLSSTVSRDEFRAAVETVEGGGLARFPSHVVDETFDEFDNDGSGSIEYAELDKKLYALARQAAARGEAAGPSREPSASAESQSSKQSKQPVQRTTNQKRAPAKAAANKVAGKQPVKTKRVKTKSGGQHTESKSNKEPADSSSQVEEQQHEQQRPQEAQDDSSDDEGDGLLRSWLAGKKRVAKKKVKKKKQPTKGAKSTFGTNLR